MEQNSRNNAKHTQRHQSRTQRKKTAQKQEMVTQGTQAQKRLPELHVQEAQPR